MQNRFDFWRAVGVTTISGFAAYIVYAIVTPLTEFSVVLFFAKEVISSVILAALFAWIYFQDERVARSAMQGVLLFLIMFVVPFAEGFLAGPAGMPAFPFENYFWTIFMCDILAMFVGTVSIGWYLAKNK